MSKELCPGQGRGERGGIVGIIKALSGVKEQIPSSDTPFIPCFSKTNQ